ncbi:MAG TPA: hypothetical protein VL357_07320 [Rariglobus sp.]|nr:hypothetical protein [Rariglobus sp.]
MKLPPSLLLTASLVVNVALLGIVVSQRNNSSHTSSSGANSSVTLTAKTSGTGSDVWKKLNPDAEPTDLMKRLRAAGFPEKIVNAIIAAQIHEHYAARRAALQTDTNAPYWSKSWNWGMGTDSKNRAALRELWRDEKQELRSTLGDAYADNPDAQRMIQRQFGNISKDKVNTAQSIVEDYQDMASDIYQSANGMMLPEDREKIAFIESEKLKDLAGILSPEELENYELRSSQTANQMRWQLSAFAPSEQEFRSIFDLQHAFDLQYPNIRSSDEAANQQRAAAQTALQDQIKASLGEARYAEYQRAQDGNFQQLANLTDRLELPKETAVAVYDFSKDIQKRAQQIRSDKNLQGDAKNQALAALADEANTKVVASLGQRGFDAYKQNGGWWLQNIAPHVAKK